MFKWYILSNTNCIFSKYMKSIFCNIQIVYSATYNAQRIHFALYKAYILQHSNCVFWNIQVVYSAIHNVYTYYPAQYYSAIHNVYIIL